jgi:hypothetical protein
VGWRCCAATRARECCRLLLRKLGRLAGTLCKAAAVGLLRPAGLEGRMGRWFRNRGLGIKGFGFLKKDSNKRIQTLNLNSNKQKQCTSMYATINSYVSLILF